MYNFYWGNVVPVDSLFLSQVLDPKLAAKCDIEKISLSEAQFRWHMNEDQMATDKLSDGIRKFAADTRKLETLIKGLLANTK